MRILVFCFFVVFSVAAHAQLAKTPAQELKSINYSYLLYLPDKYNSKSDKKWPLIIYLHGKSACGSNLDKVRRYGMPFYLDRGMKLEAIAIAPQCPYGKNWVSENWFLPFLNEMKKKYPVDENRIYLTGMSLGGFGAFSLAIKYPDIFAAVAPLCGGGQPTTACPMKDIPTWVFHGDCDKQVPLIRSTQMVEAIRKCGGHPKYSILKGQPHDIHKTYGKEELYEWMLKQSKGKIDGSALASAVYTDDETVVRDSVPKPMKPKGCFLKRIFKKENKTKEKGTEDDRKIRVEFK
jgi:predicted peptidase